MAVVVVTGGVSGTLVFVAGGETGWFGADVPSAPFDGSGGACPIPWAAGVSDLVCGG